MVREEVLKALEEKRMAKVIGSSLEAKIKLYIKEDVEYNFLIQSLETLPALFIVSQVELEKSKERSIEVGKVSGKKCSRCWRRHDTVGKESSHPTLCKRCLDVVVEGS